MDDQTGTANQNQNPPAQWSGDWFVFNNGAIQGPLSATQAFAMEATDIQGKPLLISKKGFTQWYALRELAEIFKVTEDLGRRVDKEKAALSQQQLISKEIDTRKQNAKSNRQIKLTSDSSEKRVEYFSPKLVKKQVGPKSHRVVDIRTGPSEALKLEEPIVAKTTSDAKTRAVVTKKVAPQIVGDATPYKSPIVTKTQSEPDKKKLLQEYFFIRGRLRLGKIRNPWATAFFGLPLSFGLLWPFWMGSLLKEIFYHSANRVSFPKSIVVMGFVPGLHFYGIYRLAQLVREMEMQNKYKSVSPILAAAFAVFPPFALAYLQDAANRHWLLHARHVGSPKK